MTRRWRFGVWFGRLFAGLLAAVALFGARHLGPAESQLQGARERQAALLGPLRPVVAELRLLQAELRWRKGDRAGYLEEVWTVLAMRPDVPALWCYYGSAMMLSIPRALADDALERRWFENGEKVVLRGLERHPRSAALWLTLAHGVYVAAEYYPHRLADAEDAPAWRRRVLEAASQAEAGVGLDGVLALQARSLRSRMAAAILEDEGGEEACERVLRLRERPDLSDELRALLQRALDCPQEGC